MSKQEKEIKEEMPVEEKAGKGKGKDTLPAKSGKDNRNSKKKGGHPRGKRGPKTPSGEKGDPGKSKEPRRINPENDIRWYVKYPSIVTGSSSHIFNARLGHRYRPVPVTDSTAGITYYGSQQAIPGVVSLLWTPWNGMTGSETDAVNIASKNLYTYVRHANSGSVNYESSDLMQYILAVAELFAYAEQMKRDLKMIFTFKTTNIYLYKRVLWATGYSITDINDMVTYYALYMNKLNILIAQLNSFKIPKEMTFLARHVWLSSHAWKDDELDKATTYVYCMQGFYHYDWANGELQFTPLLSNLNATLNYVQRLNALESEINNLLAYEDIGIMLGDILKAYGNDSCYFANPLIPGEIYEAEFSKEVTHQIRNAVITGSSIPHRIKQMPSNSQLLYETQSDNAPTVSPVGGGASTTLPMANGSYYFLTNLNGTNAINFSVKNPKWKFYPFLVIDSDNPTNEEIILNTRLMAIIESTSYYDGNSGNVFAKLGETGTEIIVSSAVVTYEATRANGNETDVFNAGALTTLNETVSQQSVHILAQMYKIDSIPERVFISTMGGGGSGNTFISCFYYGKNVISVEEDWLKCLHQGCKLSEFTIPMFKLLESSK